MPALDADPNPCGEEDRRASPRAVAAREWTPAERFVRANAKTITAVLLWAVGAAWALVVWAVPASLDAADARWADANLVTMHIAEYEDDALSQAIDSTDTRIAVERWILRDLQRQQADDPSRVLAEAIEDAQRRVNKLERRNELLLQKRFGG